jgi:ABC-type sugar transport system, permease component
LCISGSRGGAKVSHKKISLKLPGSYIILIAVVLFALSPFTWLIFASLDPHATAEFKLPDEVTLEQFALVFTTGDSARATINSVIIAAVSATLVLVITIFAAYPFSRMRFFCRDGILWGLIIIRVIPFSAFALPLFLLCVKFGWLNLIGAVMALTMLNLPFGLLLLKGYYDTIPLSYEEAAWVDGAGRLKTVFKILFPMCLPGAVVVWFMTFTNAWNEFMIPFILLRRSSDYPLAVYLFNSTGLYGAVDYGFMASLSIVYAIPPILAFVLLRKYMVTGLAGVGIK